jgi:hypothetical protein
MAIGSSAMTALRANGVVYRRGAAALALLIVAIGTSVSIRRKLAPLAKREAVLSDGKESLTRFRSSFVTVTAAESASWRQTADSAEIAMPKGSRLSLAQTVVKNAEDAGLHGVRVSFTQHDSAFVAPRSRGIESNDIAPADYAIAVEGVGSFAQALSFVQALPPSVSVVRFSGLRDKPETRFHIMIAVYETSRGNQTS